MYNKIIFVVSSLSQPRAIRRVESIASLGYEVEVYGYDRLQYDCNKFSANIKVTVLGQMSKGGGYLDKYNQIKHDIKKVVKDHTNQNCLYYSFGYIETLCLLQMNVPYAYEISDIAYSSGSIGKFRPLFMGIDRILVAKAVFTLMTSEGFKKYLNVKNANIIIQPNKVNRKLIGCDRKVLNKKDSSFIFAFVGSIRYQSMLRFVEVIGKYFPQHEFHFYGVANVSNTQRELDRMMSLYHNIKYFGAFKNPEDFEEIYNKVDVIVTTYGHTFNEKILDPNKLYESILFCRPLIVTEGTFLAKQVERYNCGISIDSSTEESIRDAISRVTYEQLNAISAAEKEISDTFAFDDVSGLSNLLSTIMN